ncbi:hypothetical protein [Streptomyces sp. 142MFCol3.1]|uniref:hypothetical protein n=1 Tax=Streptomyces sp. 142MFCol3.1 TaxID=1172179 RepID=UPI00048CDDEB|nr:hypothetical protein [Streptomyces sp. 142MFCol3.1]
MPADEVTHGTEVDESRVRTGPRHAAPRKPLFTRFHMPAGKAIALAAMPTAVLMGMGLTPTLAQAEDHPTAKSLTADEYQKCVEAVTGSEDGKDASDTASPSASPSASESADKATPEPSSSSDSSDTTSSSDSGSDDQAEPTPSASSSSASTSQSSSDGAASTPAPSASESSKNPLDPLGVGDALEDLLTPDDTASPTPTPSASASESTDSSASDDKSVSDTVKDTTDKVTKTVEDTVKDTTDTASKAASDATEKVQEAADAATASPSPSASESTDASDCPVATDDEGGVDNPVALPDDPWYLNASSLLLKGADYKGIVKVKTANGSTKRVLKYVISDGTDIGDLHQTVNDKQSGKTYHVQAAKGSTSTIRDGKTIMYTESISGNLLGLIPITFDPDNPPPLNIPLIYFTKVKVVQAGQFGGTLTVPGLHQYTTD